MERVAQCDAARARKDRLGPLHGVPVSVKDLMHIKGVRTTAQSRVLPESTSRTDATVVRRLREAGAIILGKNTLWEFACGVPRLDDPIAPARNPWSLAHSPGGSSSGSGAAVAGGLVGLKPTCGLVSQAGVLPLSPSLDHVGPLTRTVRDNALVLQAIAGHDPTDPLSVAPPAGLDFISAVGLPVRGMKAGVPIDLIDHASHDPEVLDAFADALDTLRALGMAIVEFELEGAAQVHADTSAILEYEVWRVHRERMRTRAHLYGHGLRARLLQARRYTRAECDRARVSAMRLARELDTLLSGPFDVLLLPGREAPAMTMDELMAQLPSARGRMTRLANLTGLPALVVPMGFSAGGLPLSLQVMARHFSDAMTYRVGAAYEAARPWHLQHPAWLIEQHSSRA